MGIISEHAPLRITPTSLGLSRGTKFVGGAAGRSHMLLVDNEGGVWGCGNNVLGQIGLVSGTINFLEVEIEVEF